MQIYYLYQQNNRVIWQKVLKAYKSVYIFLILM